MLLGLLKTLRPHQWVKNLFVLAPLFFSKSFLEPSLLGLGFLGALLFSKTRQDDKLDKMQCMLDKMQADKMHARQGQVAR